MWSRTQGLVEEAPCGKGKEASGKLGQRWWSLGLRKAFVPPGCPPYCTSKYGLPSPTLLAQGFL